MSVDAQYPNRPFPRIAFVGEAPSHEEVDSGIPLVGPSGRIFNAMLRTANLDRAEFFVGNVFDEQIPDNDVKNWTAPAIEAKKGEFDDIPPIGKLGYLKPEHRHHLARLQEEMEAVKPMVIVPLGGTALWAFTGSADISAQRGSVQLATRIVPGVKIIPTFHPAFVMQVFKYFPVVVADFIRAHREGAFPDIRIPRKELTIEPTIEELRAYLPRIYASDLLSVDIETGWGGFTSIGFAPDAEHAISIPFTDIRKPNKSYWTEEEEIEVIEIIRAILESPIPKLGQNFGGYDFFWLYDKLKVGVRNFRHDTRLLHHALYPELPKDLEFMGASYTSQGAWKSWGRKSQEKRDS